MNTFDLATQFSRFPGGRRRDDGPHSGEELREDHLIPLLSRSKGRVEVLLDGVAGLPPSFAEEAFGGLVRRLGPSVLDRVVLHGFDADEVRNFMLDAAEGGLNSVDSGRGSE